MLTVALPVGGGMPGRLMGVGGGMPEMLGTGGRGGVDAMTAVALNGSVTVPAGGGTVNNLALNAGIVGAAAISAGRAEAAGATAGATETTGAAGEGTGRRIVGTSSLFIRLRLEVSCQAWSE